MAIAGADRRYDHPALRGCYRRRFLDMMRLRLEEFALSLHPEKTRLIEFGRHAAAEREQRGLGKPETFSCLAWPASVVSPPKGRFQTVWKTQRNRMMARVLESREKMRRRMHWPISEQGGWLKRVAGGFFNYHAVLTNSRALAAFRYHVTVLWERVLRRRRQRGRKTWDRITQPVEEWLPSLVSYTFGRAFALPSNTRGRRRMQASRSYGSMRGAQ